MDVTSLLESFGIHEYGIIDFEKVNIINSRLLPSGELKSVLMLLAPYKNSKLRARDGLNAGHFARCRDYHTFYEKLFEELLPRLCELCGGEAYGFADHSPIAEKDAAFKCGLGFIGQNSLLVNKRYGSFVVIGTVLLTERLNEHILNVDYGCGDCHSCVKACPTGALDGGFSAEGCLSALSQKKKKSDAERAVLVKNKTVWGCDICQSSCPYNRNAEPSELEYFSVGFIESFNAELIDNMNETEYKSYAFSYRERKVIAENILTVENNRDIIKLK